MFSSVKKGVSMQIAKMNSLEQKIFDMVRNELKPEQIPEQYKDHPIIKHPYNGHCHHAALAMYQLLEGKSNGYKLRKAIDELNITHYWLETKEGHIIDPTAEQYTELKRDLPYEKLLKTGISYRPTKAVKIIVENVKQKL